MTYLNAVQQVEHIARNDKRQTLAELVDSIPYREIVDLDEDYIRNAQHINFATQVTFGLMGLYLILVVFVLAGIAGHTLGWW